LLLLRADVVTNAHLLSQFVVPPKISGEELKRQAATAKAKPDAPSPLSLGGKKGATQTRSQRLKRHGDADLDVSGLGDGGAAEEADPPYRPLEDHIELRVPPPSLSGQEAKEPARPSSFSAAGDRFAGWGAEVAVSVRLDGSQFDPPMTELEQQQHGSRWYPAAVEYVSQGPVRVCSSGCVCMPARSMLWR
jgi:hypothetical protein